MTLTRSPFRRSVGHHGELPCLLSLSRNKSMWPGSPLPSWRWSRAGA